MINNRTASSVLHICSDYSRQAVYSELVSSLSRLGIRQSVYVPVRTAPEMGAHRDETAGEVCFRYAHILRPHHRLFFRSKIRRIFADLTLSMDLAGVGITHAHFLYSDGAVALRLWKETGIPFVVAVRNTDMNVFMKWRPDLYPLCLRILREASRVVFVSPAYREEMLRRVSGSIREDLEFKAAIVPNGVSDYWLDEPVPEGRVGNGTLKLLYVGDLSRNKNVPGTIRAAAILQRYREVFLTIVGDGGDGETDVDAMLKNPALGFVTRLGRVTDREHLAGIFSDHDMFVMPSFKETFGVVYIEALSRGLPVVFSQGQAIDGYFESGVVCEAVDPHDAGSIAAGIGRLAERLTSVRAACIEGAQRFRWAGIARTYEGLYRDISRQGMAG